MRGVWTGGSAAENSPLLRSRPTPCNCHDNVYRILEPARLTNSEGQEKTTLTLRLEAPRVPLPDTGGQPFHRRDGLLFRRDGVAVPAQRHHCSGGTVTPFRRDGTPVPAGETGRTDRKVPIFSRYLPVLRWISIENAS